MNKPFISILLPTYNRLYSLKRYLLPSLNVQMFDDYELIVIDDGSTDGTSEYFQNRSFVIDYPNLSNKIVYIKNKHNIGKPSCNNLAIKISKGDWVFTVEDDIEIIDFDFLKKAKILIKELGLEYEIISPKIEVENQYNYDNLFDGFCRVGAISQEIYLNTNYKKRVYNSLSTHACSFINREVFILNKYPNISGLAFREESDFYLNARNKGAKILYLGDDLKIIHHSNKSKIGGTRNNNNFISKIKNIIVFHYKYLQRNFNFPNIRILFFIVIFLFEQLSINLRIISIKRLLVRISL